MQKNFHHAQILKQVNKSVYDDAKISEVFATLSVVVVNKKTKILKYAGAGDLPILYRNVNTANVEKMISGGSLLGFSSTGEFDDIELKMNSGDFVLMLTDGVIESRNSEGVALETKGLIEIIKKIEIDNNPLKHILKNVNAVTGGKFEDDISLIAIKAE